MTYIIAEPCVGVCDTACVEVCPVDCIHFTKDKDRSGPPKLDSELSYKFCIN
jgi:ferredoxin